MPTTDHDAPASPSRRRRAVVVGAGMGGLCAARALADHFEQVVLLERDGLPADPVPRAGTPQARHVHVLLAGGLRALDALFPGFEDELRRAGAVPIRAGLDLRIERPGFDPFPQRDVGFLSYSMSRALLEHRVRQRVVQQPHIVVRDRCRVLDFVPSADGSSVRAVRCEEASAGAATEIEADLVVDASGRGGLCLDLLRATGRPVPSETTLGVDVGYSTVVFAIPEDAPIGWVNVLHAPQAPHSGRGAFLFSIEGRRWMVALGGRGDDKPPGDIDGFLAFARGLRTSTIADALRHARPQGEVARFAFPSSVWRRYRQLGEFPRGLLPFGDAICRFNPLYGQGMSVVAREACVLRELLGRSEPLVPAFLAAADELIETPWSMSALPDLMFPQTVGERPADLQAALQFGAALNRLAAADPDVHRLTLEVQHLLRPRSALREPALVARVMAAPAAAQGSSTAGMRATMVDARPLR